METNTKTLVIRFSSIGDIVLASPLLRVLRKRFPHGQIDFVTKRQYADLVRFNQNINVTHEYDDSTGFDGLRRLKRKLREERYDLVVDIHNSLRSRYVRSLLGVKKILVVEKQQVERALLVRFKKNLYARPVSVADRYITTVRELGIENDGKGLEVHLPDEILFGISGRVARLRLNRFERVLGLCPGARHATKRWPTERFAEVGARFARDADGVVMLFGGEEDRDAAGEIVRRIIENAGTERVVDWTGQLSLLETAAALEYCDAVVTNDTGLMHLAVAMHKKIVAMFGSTVREFGFFPLADDAIVLERTGLPCRPCSHIGRDECPEEHFRCMRDIGVDEVFKAVSGLLRTG
jgi:heptosyltransferase-2